MLHPRIATPWDAEIEFLCELLATALADTTAPYILEIGSHQGHTSRILADSSADRTLICIDPWNDPSTGSSKARAQFIQNMAHCTNTIVFDSPSQEILPQLPTLLKTTPPFLAFAFIDGDHSYDPVRQDIINTWPLIAPGGVMALHDALDPAWGPPTQLALHDFAHDYSIFRHIPSPTELNLHQANPLKGGIAYLTKPA